MSVRDCHIFDFAGATGGVVEAKSWRLKHTFGSDDEPKCTKTCSDGNSDCDYAATGFGQLRDNGPVALYLYSDNGCTLDYFPPMGSLDLNPYSVSDSGSGRAYPSNQLCMPDGQSSKFYQYAIDTSCGYESDPDPGSSSGGTSTPYTYFVYLGLAGFAVMVVVPCYVIKKKQQLNQRRLARLRAAAAAAEVVPNPTLNNNAAAGGDGGVGASTGGYAQAVVTTTPTTTTSTTTMTMLSSVSSPPSMAFPPVYSSSTDPSGPSTTSISSSSVFSGGVTAAAAAAAQPPPPSYNDVASAGMSEVDGGLAACIEQSSGVSSDEAAVQDFFAKHPGAQPSPDEVARALNCVSFSLDKPKVLIAVAQGMQGGFTCGHLAPCLPAMSTDATRLDCVKAVALYIRDKYNVSILESEFGSDYYRKEAARALTG